jgi:antitoxin MazE
MEAVIEKWGNKLGIKIPNLIARKLELTDGTFIEISNVGQEIHIHPKPKSQLAAMLDSISEANIHEQVETGDPVGNEIW